MSEELKRTPLYEAHLAAGAKMVTFAGWQMPVQYTGILAEHHSVRSEAGLFDVSHMGEIELRGPGSLAALQHLLTNDLSRLKAGQAQYALLTNEQGGIIDDVIAYCVDPGGHYLVCVNASNADKDFAWMAQRGAAHCQQIENTSASWAQLALQGPLAETLLAQAFEGERWAEDLSELSFMEFRPGQSKAGRLYLARSGYTGEDGFEIFLPPDAAPEFWERLVAGGARACGLGARDTLRLEMKYPLHGSDIDEDTTPLEAGLGFAVRLEKEEAFAGRDLLRRQKQEGIARKLVGFELAAPGIARHGYPVIAGGESVGQVRSGTQSPTLGRSIGLAYLPRGRWDVGSRFGVEIRGKEVPAQVAKTPFVEPHVKR